jgi:Flp pilus assembly secretin CpaC
LFNTKANNQDRTELMVLVTPRLVRPLNPDDVPPLPTMENKFIQGDSVAPGNAGSGNSPANR